MLFRTIGSLTLLVCCSLAALSQSTASSAEALGASAASARDRGDLPRAIELYKQAVATDPHWADGWWFLGNLEYGLDQFQPAREALSQFIVLSPKAAPALALRGLCAYELGAFTDSLNDLQRAIALGAANQPKNAQILLYHEALLQTRLGRFEEAIATYSTFVKQGTTNQDIVVGLGLAGLRIPLLPQAVPQADLQVAALSGQAAAMIIAGDIAGGRRAFQQVLAAYPNRQNVHYFCGYLLLSTDPDQAVEELQAELSVDPASTVAHTMLAWTLELRGEYSDALPVAQAAVQADASSATNQLVLGRALLETGDAKGALSHLDQALAADPGNLEAHLSLAKTYSELGRKDEAHEQRLLCLKIADQKTAGHASE